MLGFKEEKEEKEHGTPQKKKESGEEQRESE
jgi:hypothetical protein